jgi:hypothetical protein
MARTRQHNQQGAATADAAAASPAPRRIAVRLAAWAILPGALLSVAAQAPAAQAASTTAATATATATARIQTLLDHPVNGTVHLPAGTFTIRPDLVLHHGERITGHHTTLKVASGSGNYEAVLAGATATTDLSGLNITGVTFDQNSAGNPIRNLAVLDKGYARFVILIVRGTDIAITGNRFDNSDNVNTIVTGGATHDVTISRNTFANTTDAPMHDHSTIYTSGTSTRIAGNTFGGRAAYATAIEVHGSDVAVTGNRVSGYYKATNIDASDVTFTRNHVTAAANPVDIWSTAPAATTDVTITGNVLNRDRSYWTTVLHHIGRAMPAPRYTRQVIREAASTLPFHDITVHDNTGH